VSITPPLAIQLSKITENLNSRNQGASSLV